MSLAAARRGHVLPAVTRVSAAQVLNLPVCLRGIQLGRATDLILDRDRRRVLGIEVRCGDEARRFLPFAVARVEDGAIAISSTLVLLDRAELAFYTERGSTFTALRGVTVHRGGDPLGTLADVEFAADGAIEVAAVATPEGGVTVRYDEVAIAPAAGTGVRAAS